MKKDRGSLAGLKPRSLETYVSSALGHPIHRYYTIHLGFVKPKNDGGLFILLIVECLGSCGTAPMMQVDETYYEKSFRLPTTGRFYQ